MVPVLAAQELPKTRPSVSGVFPHGAQVGTDVEITIRGANLQNASAIQFVTPKLSAEILKAEHNIIQARFHVEASAEPGRHDFHVIAPHGSTLAWFDVGTRPESTEKEPNDDQKTAQSIEFPVLINGIVRPRDYDYFKFSVRTGQSITFDLSGSRNESGLDAVLSLLDENGEEIAYNDDYYWFKDPHLVHTFEQAGTYFLRVYGTGESGSATDDYRLTAGEMPHVYHAMPLGAQRGEPVDVQLFGVNLGRIEKAVLGEGIAEAEILSREDRSARIRLMIPKETPNGVYRLHVDGATLPVPFAVSDLPEVTVTTGSAGSKEDAYPVTLPVIANGVIDVPRAAHHFTFRVDEPQTILLAVDSFRFDYHLDPIVILYDEAGQRLAYQDDPTTNSAKEPANVDPHLVFHLPKAGRYTVRVRDNAFRGDPNYPYRLTLKRAAPDFTAGVVGTDDTLFRGREHIVMVQVRRLEGWNTPVEIRAENLPRGVSGPEKVIVPIEPTRFKGTCGEEHILDGTKIEYPLRIAADAPPGLSKIRFRARSVMDSRVVEHEVIPRYWFKPLTRIMGPAQSPELYATVADLPQVVLETPDRISLRIGEQKTIQVVITRLDGGGEPMELRPVEPPEGLVMEPVMVRAGATLADAKVKVSAGGPFSVVLEGIAAGKFLGRSHPIEIAVSGGTSRREVAADDQ
jgi:hypothetical protein